MESSAIPAFRLVRRGAAFLGVADSFAGGFADADSASFFVVRLVAADTFTAEAAVLRPVAAVLDFDAEADFEVAEGLDAAADFDLAADFVVAVDFDLTADFVVAADFDAAADFDLAADFVVAADFEAFEVAGVFEAAADFETLEAVRDALVVGDVSRFAASVFPDRAARVC